jgi:hypothetical protein
MPSSIWQTIEKSWILRTKRQILHEKDDHPKKRKLLRFRRETSGSVGLNMDRMGTWRPPIGLVARSTSADY